MTMNDQINAADDAAQIRRQIEAWAQAVRRRDMDGILRDHADDIVMFDVPPPLLCKGIEAYRATWQLFFDASPTPPVFDIQELDITAGSDVGFAVALMRCVVVENGQASNLDFRLTIGFRKVGGNWLFVHEHHSIPALS
jgi:ketosteroid isomerase-like protein